MAEQLLGFVWMWAIALFGRHSRVALRCESWWSRAYWAAQPSLTENPGSRSHDGDCC